jgi:N-dimethylarginine dimethylaminohydrolase
MGKPFTHAIVRPPSASFAQGIPPQMKGRRSLSLALEQHARYCEALQDCGLQVTCLDPDPQYPDGTFVEDTAVITERGAILARPGAPSRDRRGRRHGARRCGTVLLPTWPISPRPAPWMAATFARWTSIS